MRKFCLLSALLLVCSIFCFACEKSNAEVSNQTPSEQSKNVSNTISDISSDDSSVAVSNEDSENSSETVSSDPSVDSSEAVSSDASEDSSEADIIPELDEKTASKLLKINHYMGMDILLYFEYCNDIEVDYENDTYFFDETAPECPSVIGIKTLSDLKKQLSTFFTDERIDLIINNPYSGIIVTDNNLYYLLLTDAAGGYDMQLLKRIEKVDDGVYDLYSISEYDDPDDEPHLTCRVRYVDGVYKIDTI